MSSPRSRRIIAYALMYGQLLAARFILPDSPLRHFDEPVYLAVTADFITVGIVS